MIGGKGLAIIALVCAAAVFGSVAAYAFVAGDDPEPGVTSTAVEAIDGLTITYVSGTADDCTLYFNSNGEYTVKFGAVTTDTVYRLAGTLNGNIAVAAGTGGTFTLELDGLSVASSAQCPLAFGAGAVATVTAVAGTENSLNDFRAASGSAALAAAGDLNLSGERLKVTATSNAGVQAGGQLAVAVTALSVNAGGHALQSGGDLNVAAGSLELRAGGAGLTAGGAVQVRPTAGDIVLKVFTGGYGISAAGAVDLADTEDHTLSVTVDTGNYANDKNMGTATVYVGTTNKSFRYSILATAADGTQTWVSSASEYVLVQSALAKYYLYSMVLPSGTQSYTVYMYDVGQAQGQQEYYYAASMTEKPSPDHNAMLIKSYSRDGMIQFEWYNYTKAGSGGSASPAAVGIAAGGKLTLAGGSLSIRSVATGLYGGTAVALEPDYLFVRAGAEAVATGSTAAGSIAIEGGRIVLIAVQAPIGAAGGYEYGGGQLVCLGSTGAAAVQQMQNCGEFGEEATAVALTGLAGGQYVTVTLDDSLAAAVRLADETAPGGPGRNPQTPGQGQGVPAEYYAVYYGSAAAAVASAGSIGHSPDANGVYWADYTGPEDEGPEDPDEPAEPETPEVPEEPEGTEEGEPED